MKSRKKLLQSAIESQVQHFFSPDRHALYWTIETRQIDPFIVAVWDRYEFLLEQAIMADTAKGLERIQKKREKNLERIAVRRARFGLPMLPDILQCKHGHDREAEDQGKG